LTHAPQSYYPVSMLPAVHIPNFSAFDKEQKEQVPMSSSAAAGKTEVVASSPAFDGPPAVQPTQVVELESMTLSANGPAYTSDGHIYSLASAGLQIDGKLATAAPGASPVAAFSAAILTLGTAIVTASRSPRTPSVAIIGDKSLFIGGQAITTSGHTLSLDLNGLVIDGTSTVPFTIARATQTGVSIVAITKESAGAPTDDALHKVGSTPSAGQLALSSGSSTVGNMYLHWPSLVIACLVSVSLL
jgi:hypothetical protein